MPFDWTLNPYRGCTHGCHYCYARRYHVQFEMNADDEFASVILVKKNFVEVLARELARPSWTGEYVAVGTATDCYQPIKGHYKLTRGAIGALIRARNPMGLITKGPMVVRDRDLLVQLSKVAACTVYISVPTVDEHAFPSLVPRYEKLYEKKYAPADYRKQVQGMVRALQQQYNVGRREDADRGSPADEAVAAEQVGFAW